MDPAPDGPPVTVLVVDDNADAADTLAAVLDLLGCVVRVVYSAQDALAALENLTPDLVVIDIGLPGMDGWEATRRIRASLGPRVLIVAHTGYGHQEDRARSTEAGIDLHLLKPVELDALEQVVTTARVRRGPPWNQTP